MAEIEAVSLRKFAAMQGWNPAVAHKLKVAGRLVMLTAIDGRELVDVAQSLTRIAESSDPQKGYMAGVNAQQRERRRAALAAKAAVEQPASDELPPVIPPAPELPLPGPMEAPAVPAESEVPGGPQNRNATYNEARTSREVFQAKLSQLEYEQQVGRLVDADAVRAEFAKQILGVRDQFLKLPDRLAPMLVGLDDIAVIKQTLMVEVRTALTQFEAA